MKKTYALTHGVYHLEGLFFIKIISDMLSSFAMCRGKGRDRKWSSWSTSAQHRLFGISKC